MVASIYRRLSGHGKEIMQIQLSLRCINHSIRQQLYMGFICMPVKESKGKRYERRENHSTGTAMGKRDIYGKLNHSKNRINQITRHELKQSASIIVKRKLLGGKGEETK